jgi:hypothetical protein
MGPSSDSTLMHGVTALRRRPPLPTASFFLPSPRHPPSPPQQAQQALQEAAAAEEGEEEEQGEWEREPPFGGSGGGLAAAVAVEGREGNHVWQEGGFPGSPAHGAAGEGVGGWLESMPSMVSTVPDPEGMERCGRPALPYCAA